MEHKLVTQGSSEAPYRTIINQWVLSVGLAGFSVVSAVWAADQAAPAPTVQENMDVALDYTLMVDGSVVDSTEGKKPFHYVHGKGQIVPGLEHQLAGLHVGDQKEVTVKPEEGYGKTDPAAVIEVPKTQLPPDVKPEVGMILRGVNPDGQSFRATIREVKNDKVMLDLNHPLAGKTLNFKIKIIGIAPAQAPTPPPAPTTK